MLQRYTTFVLGAGASQPFDFPTGGTLSQDICDGGLPDRLAEFADEFSAEEVERFTSAFRRSGQASIDAFLERRTEYEWLGKLAIAAQLCAREDPDKPVAYGNAQNWYRPLWTEMTARTTSAAEARMNVAFVTFNYDRSLEHFLFSSAKNTYNLNDEDAVRFVRDVPIIHVYGLLGGYHYSTEMDRTARLYHPLPDKRELTAAAQGIHLIPGGRGDGRTFATARHFFDVSQDICFLGFGFDEINVERLDLANVLMTRHGRLDHLPSVTMSTMGKTKAQIARIKAQLLGAAPVQPFTVDGTCMETISEAGIVR